MVHKSTAAAVSGFFGAFAVSFGLDQICSASFCNCISTFNLFKLSVDFFSPLSFVEREGGKKAQEHPEVFTLVYG